MPYFIFPRVYETNRQGKLYIGKREQHYKADEGENKEVKWREEEQKDEIKKKKEETGEIRRKGDKNK